MRILRKNRKKNYNRRKKYIIIFERGEHGSSDVDIAGFNAV